MDFSNYPFGHAALLGGLRQFMGAPSLKLNAITTITSPQVVAGHFGAQMYSASIQHLQVQVLLDGQQYPFWLLLTQDDAPALKRVIQLNDFLASQLPVLLPGYITGSVDDGWMVQEAALNLRHPHEWTVDDYRELVDNLAMLHDRYWGLEEDLDIFEWLPRPLDRGFGRLLTQLAENVAALTDTEAWFSQGRWPAMFGALQAHLAAIVAPLQAEPLTLTHGNYWAGTVGRPVDGRQIITGWRNMAIAPAILDVVRFHHQTISHLKPAMPIKAALARYRIQLAERQKNRVWSDTTWETLRDHGLMWLVISEWLPILVNNSAEIHNNLERPLANFWFPPTIEALDKYFGVKI